MSLAALIERIHNRRASISVIGLGYVGLPLAITFAEAGFQVTGIDRDSTRVAAINRRESYIPDVNSERLALVMQSRGERLGAGPACVPPGLGRLSATASYDALAETDAVLICVPTPLSKTRDPDLSHILAATDEIARRLHPDMLVVLESTTYPGATEELVLPRLRNANGQVFKEGRNFFLAFSPERIDPGNQDWNLKNTPKVIGGATASCLRAATALYECTVQQVVSVSSPRVAEMVKLLENTFRATNIALVNEFAIMCERLDVDVWEVIEAAKTKPFGYMPFYPGPGLGGHCLPVDPQYLAWKMRTLNYRARFVQLAEEINFGMPAHVLSKITDSLNDAGKALNGSTILVLGVAYKADVGDVRESPALDLIPQLQEKGARVAYHDPYVPRLDVGRGTLESVSLTETALRGADCVVIITAHRTYDWDWVVRNSRLIVDTRNATSGVAPATTRVVKL